MSNEGQMTVDQSWWDGYVALQARIEADPQFMEVVRSYEGDPQGHIPTRRGRRVAIEICKRLDLDPSIYLGNVFGAAADRIRRRVPDKPVLDPLDEMHTYSVTVRAFDRISVRNIEAASDDEARERALDAVNFKVEVKPQ